MGAGASTPGGSHAQMAELTSRHNLTIEQSYDALARFKQLDSRKIGKLTPEGTTADKNASITKHPFGGRMVHALASALESSSAVKSEVTLDQFMHGMKIHSPEGDMAKPHAKLQIVFHLLDSDQDGFLRDRDIRDAISRVFIAGPERDKALALVPELLASVSGDRFTRSPVVTFDQFRKYFQDQVAPSL